MAEQKSTKQTDAKVKNEGQQTLRETASTWTETLREAAGTIADSAVALQDRNVEYAQTLIDQSFDQMESQTAKLHETFNTLVAQSAKRRAAFRNLVRETFAASVSAMATPTKFYREALKSVQESADSANA
jgi:uncharacterized protein YdiU (UPF0061 family)